MAEATRRETGVNVAISRSRTMRSVIPARAIRSRPSELTGATLDSLAGRLSTSGGRVLIGIKATGAPRSSATGVLAALTANEMQSALARLRERGVEVTRTYSNFAFVAARLTAPQLAAVAELPFVDYIEVSEELVPQAVVQRAPPPPSLPTQDTSWGVFRIRAHEVWEGTYGPATRGDWANITIIDSGLDSVHLWSPLGDGPEAIFVDCLYVQGTLAASSCYDQSAGAGARGHGAHVAGIISGRDNSTGWIGIANAPNRVTSINVCGSTSECPLEAVAFALDWAIDETVDGFRPRHIVNISIGHCTGSTSMEAAIQAAWSAGLIVVASAGNTNSCGGSNALRYPAAYEQTIAVAGVLENNAFAAPGASASCNAAGISAGSVAGAGIDLVAPYSAHSAWANGSYRFVCGTSMSAPVVSGVAALLWSRNPSWTNTQVRARLESTAQFVGSASHFGSGLVDPLNALYGYTPLNASIAGPGVVTVPGNTQWIAFVTGGVGANSYAWRISTVGPEGPFAPIGSGATVTLNIDPSGAYEFWLSLNVTSGSESRTDVVRVVNETGNPCAPLVCSRNASGAP